MAAERMLTLCHQCVDETRTSPARPISSWPPPLPLASVPTEPKTTTCRSSLATANSLKMPRQDREREKDQSQPFINSDRKSASEVGF